MIEYIFGIVIGLSHFFSENISDLCIGYRKYIASFGAGISITYLFLELFPLVYEGVAVIKEFIFLAVLFGFVLFHSIEKHVYHNHHKDLKWELKEVHSVSLFIYHVIAGIIIVGLSKLDIVLGLLFFLPILLNSTFSALSLEHVHAHLKEQKAIKLFLSLSTIVGILIANFITIPPFIFQTLLGFVVGAMLYITIRDHLPKDKEGEVSMFLVGSLLYAALIVSLWSL